MNNLNYASINTKHMHQRSDPDANNTRKKKKKKKKNGQQQQAYNITTME